MHYPRSPQDSPSSAPTSTPTAGNCDPSNFYSVSNGTSVPCSTTNNSGNLDAFSSGSLWAIVLSIIAGLVGLALFLWLLKKWIRQRQRQRIRNALWDIVRGIQDGTIEESYLRRIVDAEIYNGERAPILYETHLALPLGRSGEKSKSPFADPKPISTKWKWRDLLPLSISPPYPLSSDPKLAYPKMKPRRTSLLSWKGRPLSLQSFSSKSRANLVVEETELQSRTSTSRESRFFQPQEYVVRIERGLDTIVTITMPHPDRPHYLSPSTKPTNPHPQIGDVPLKLGTLSTSFLEDILEPIEPPRKRAPKPPFFQRKKETFSDALREMRRQREEERRREREELERVRRERVGMWADEPTDWLGLSNVQYRRPTRPVGAAVGGARGGGGP